ncbi:MAG: polysaccharide biosynthesis tyrosine autokinase [Acidobacteriota bacterium]
MSNIGDRTGRRDGNRDDRGRAEATASPHLLHYLRVLSKRRWTALGTLVLVVALTAVVTIRAVPVYEARAQVMIEVERPRVIVFADDEKTDRADESRDYQETQRRILQSRALASRTIESLGLWQHPEFGGGEPEQLSYLDAKLEVVRNFFAAIPKKFAKSPNYSRGALTKPEGPDPDESLGFKEKAEQSPAINAFLEHVEVREVGSSRLVDVAFKSADPKLAAAVANGLTEAYIVQNREFKSTVAKESADWLAKQLEENRKQLRVSQDTLQKYREQRPDASGGEGTDLVLRRLEGLNAALLNARTDRIQKETLFNQVQALKSNRTALDSLQIVQADTAIQGLKKEISTLEQQDAQLAQKFGERHPDRVRLRLSIDTSKVRLDAQMASVLDRLRNDYMAARQQEANLTQAVELQKRDATASSGKRAEYDTLARAASTDQEIFATLLQRTKETGVTTGLVASNIRIVDPASVPHTPVSPNPRRNLLMALFGGTLLALCAAFFAEYMDKGITSPEQLTNALGLTCLGLVPLVDERKHHANEPPLINANAPEALQEAFRSVRTNVLFSARGEPIRNILITSTGPGEGKTLVATNLAMSIAQTGPRVLLLDADMRRPRVHTLFPENAQSPGLSEFIAGRATPSEAIVRTSVPGLWLMPSGSIPPNPSELLCSDRFTRFITGLSEFFDWVLIDSPPVLAVTDASLLAHVAAGVLFVVAAEESTVPAAKIALDQLDHAEARFLGAVLNKVNFKRNSFYYADYYRQEYGAYHTKAAPVTANAPERRSPQQIKPAPRPSPDVSGNTRTPASGDDRRGSLVARSATFPAEARTPGQRG